MSDLTIHTDIEATKGKVYIGDINAPDAAMTFSKVGSTMLIIDHTEVDDTMRGKGVGRQLLRVIVAMAREQQIKILPLCPYAKSVFDKDASIQDVLK